MSGVLTQEQTHKCGAGGALEIDDLRVFEDGSEHSGTLRSDFVAAETASEGHDGKR